MAPSASLLIEETRQWVADDEGHHTAANLEPGNIQQ